MRDIAREAGISVASLYQYFPSQDDLFAAILIHDLAHIKKKLCSDSDSLETIAVMIMDFLIHQEVIFHMLCHFMVINTRKNDSFEKFQTALFPFTDLLNNTILKTAPLSNPSLYSYALFTFILSNVITYRNNAFINNTSYRDHIYHGVRLIIRSFENGLMNDESFIFTPSEKKDLHMA
jgi:AcrR family transcriptional regulator